ncbi:hypothetical protein IscW_ISCW018592 [Ixodes scapularis]|uniref:Uncharacterized protein n=1 Tax=Ixodes scapularis TaxID=6945 RepID=B7PM82_IXOSC|nr:hypothetical protein IscW_ISCW018592 [Ixodes scapularis]|eukprot:XP_002434880.1 hypothetical protein IscW_ISCW018592 [Ixodes scapularis]
MEKLKSRAVTAGASTSADARVAQASEGRRKCFPTPFRNANHLFLPRLDPRFLDAAACKPLITRDVADRSRRGRPRGGARKNERRETNRLIEGRCIEWIARP